MIITMLRQKFGYPLAKGLGFVALFAAALFLSIACSGFPGSPGSSSSSGSPSSVGALPPPLPASAIDCLGGTTAAVAVQPLAVDELALGTNLAGIADWSTQLPFLDAFKSSRSWITQCDADESGCSGSWATEETEQLDLDEHGWVKSLPAPEDPPEYTRVATFLFGGTQGRYPGGQYVVLYDGEGTIGYRFDAQKDEAASRLGRDIINVTPSNDGIWFQITATDPNRTGNYIRNIHVVPIEYEDTFATEIFNPLFLERTQPFRAVRFMDWMRTNNSEQREWADRPVIEDASYALKGVPVEVMITLANRLGVHPWFTLPHQATDEYIANFAQTVQTCLDPRLTAYAEFSNEVWNQQFQQSHYALEQGQSRWGQDKEDAFMQWYGMRTAQMSDLWKQVFREEPQRVATVMATQTAWRGLETGALDCPLWVAEGNAPCYQHGIDVFAITGYFSGSLGSDAGKSAIESWLSEADGGMDKALTQLKQGNLIPGEGTNDTIASMPEYFQYYRQVAQDKGLHLVAYEAGQHLVRPDSEALTEFFIELNRHPGMYDVYTQLLDNWKNAEGNLFMHYSDIGLPSQWGSWGAVEAVDQASSPKYDALIDFINKQNL